MKYERLTTKDETPCTNCSGIGWCKRDCDNKKRYDRLVELEDKIESGKMSDFPYGEMGVCCGRYNITRPPQSWFYVEEKI